MPRVLVVDDQSGMRRSLAILLKKAGFEVREAENGERAIDCLEDEVFDLVITDLKMSPGTGLDVLKHAKEMHPQTEVIIMTAYGTVDTAVQAMKMGAFDYISKPFKHEEILHRVGKSISWSSIRGEQGPGQKKVQADIVGESNAVREMLSMTQKIASVDLPVLITGETGTGKNLVATKIHELSQRFEKPFVALNCAGIPEYLLESELFGHTKGAFTGAFIDRKGMFAEAEGGSLLLDEIGSMPYSMQAKLLDVLQDRMVRRVGGNESREVDVRIMAATNTDLEQEVREGRFREDLFFRIKVTHIHVPPLREHLEDVALLARHFLESYKNKFGKSVLEISAEVMEFLAQYDYPGNVRELNNIISSAATIASGSVIAMQDLCLTFTKTIFDLSSTKNGYEGQGTLEEREKDLIIKSIRKHPGNLSKVCEELGIGRTTLWRKMRKYQI